MFDSIRVFLLRAAACSLVAWCAACSFIDSFDYTFVDDASVSDAGPDGTTDSGSVDGGGPGADGSTVDASGPRTCDTPCVSDAILDFDPAEQGSAPGEWRYIQDFRDAAGLTYGDLIAGDVMGVSGWTDGSPPPAVANCVDQGTTGPCQVAGERLLMVADDPGTGGDPVLDYVVPSNGSYRVDVSHVGNGGQMELLVSRNARFDFAASSSFLPSAAEAAFSAPMQLLAGDHVLVTARPDATVTSAGQLGVSARVVQDPSTAPLADCMFALRFEDPSPLTDECGGITLEDRGAGTPDATTSFTGPNSMLGQARDFGRDAFLRSEGVRFDYSGDFTFQVWARIVSNNNFSTAIYADWSAFDPANTGGISLSIDPDDDMGTDDIITAAFLYPDLADNLPSSLPEIDCETEQYCTGSIVTTIPSFSEWHFYRIVRDADADHVRFCIDGVEVGRAPLDGSIDLSNPSSPKLGTFFFDGRNANLNAAIDDVRILRRALPCDAPP